MDEGLLHYYNTEWDRYTTAMRYINHIFQYLVNYKWKGKALLTLLSEPTLDQEGG